MELPPFCKIVQTGPKFKNMLQNQRVESMPPANDKNEILLLV